MLPVSRQQPDLRRWILRGTFPADAACVLTREAVAMAHPVGCDRELAYLQGWPTTTVRQAGAVIGRRFAALFEETSARRKVVPVVRTVIASATGRGWTNPTMSLASLAGGNSGWGAVPFAQATSDEMRSVHSSRSSQPSRGETCC
jgi:hypothetical protein